MMPKYQASFGRKKRPGKETRAMKKGMYCPMSCGISAQICAAMALLSVRSAAASVQPVFSTGALGDAALTEPMVIAGCTEVPLVLDDEDVVLELIDPGDLLALQLVALFADALLFFLAPQQGVACPLLGELGVLLVDLRRVHGGSGLRVRGLNTPYDRDAGRGGDQ